MDNDDGELTDRQRDMLDFERIWWQSPSDAGELIRAGSPAASDEYYAELNQVLELPGRWRTIRSWCGGSIDGGCVAAGR